MLLVDDLKRICTTMEDRTALDVEEIIMLLQLCLNATYICFRGRNYEQTFGTAMGSPVSVMVANLVMEEIEEIAPSTYHTPACSTCCTAWL